MVSFKPFDLSTCFSLRAFRWDWISVSVWRVWHTHFVLFKDSLWHKSKQVWYVSLQGWGASAKFSQMVQFGLIKMRSVMTPYKSSVKQILFGGEKTWMLENWLRERTGTGAVLTQETTLPLKHGSLALSSEISSFTTLSKHNYQSETELKRRNTHFDRLFYPWMNAYN